MACSIQSVSGSANKGKKMSKKMPPEYYQMLEEIQAIDFVIVELNLYLDTHPDDTAAIKQFNEATKKKYGIKGRI